VLNHPAMLLYGSSSPKEMRWYFSKRRSRGYI